MLGCNRAYDRLFVLQNGYATCCNAEVAKAARIDDPTYSLSPDQVWRHPTFQELRRKVSSGDWEWCSKCPLVHEKKVPVKVEPPEGPRHIHLVDSSSCNLFCPSCRPRLFTENSKAQERRRERLHQIMDRFLPGAKSLKMLGSGEVFASPMHVEVLESLSRDKHPELNLNLITNGTLLPKFWPLLPNIHDMIFRIEISMDAASEKTYGKLRLGGGWDKVIEALELCASLRGSGSLRIFHMNFCANKINANEVPQFVEMADHYGARAIVTVMRQWYPSQWYNEHTLIREPGHKTIRWLQSLDCLKQRHVTAPEILHFDDIFLKANVP